MALRTVSFSMRELLQQVVESLAAGRPVACCRLVETRGSTPQKPGAMMLVFADGSQSGTLGGGCVEAEVKRQALAALRDSTATIASFTLDDDYGWDDGLICGGAMRVLLDPLAATDADAQSYLRTLAELVQQGCGGTEAIVYDGQQCGLPAPSWYLIDRQGRLAATRSAAVESGVLPDAIRAGLPAPQRRPRATEQRGIAYLPLVGRQRLLIVGGGHVGQAVADLAGPLQFDVWVVDDRQEFVAAERFPQAERRICGEIGKALADLEITPETYCLIVTRGHNHDEEALLHLVNRGAAYVGMIGSRRKIRIIFEDLIQEGIAPESLEKVHAPVGIDIGSQTVPEIALSIAAELVAHRNRGGQVPGRPPRPAIAAKRRKS
jgi:xanthine dehydrogenase accessory factor